ncbi:coiled-coil domain-containing protein 124-like [Anthonomus grandis grandis]|uniref:coiled-coil domain-containing protein 124-like n=1 Tax=Anthonomus grandis grandis TaxID=2921223 RepID=UPI002165EDDE|nr:coiled-coil domain-containing protein 124-like [Anthonomus grandis grandis]
MRKKTITDNPKAIAARERKKAAQEEKEAIKEREIEDAKWREDDKQILKKQQKKAADERKKHDQLKRKAEAKALLEMEMASIETMLKLTKVTRAEITIKEEEQPKKKIEKIIPLLENLNRVKVEHEEARTVDEAIKVLDGTSGSIDKHPERRIKAAYTAYEARRLDELKVKNPTLRVSQLRQMIFKEWQKSPENPYNKIQPTNKSYYLKNYRLVS